MAQDIITSIAAHPFRLEKCREFVPFSKQTGHTWGRPHA
jgi:hypothetical protein